MKPTIAPVTTIAEVTMADPTPTQAEQIKKLIENYFQELHASASNTRHCARSSKVVMLDGLAKIALADADELMSKVTNQEEGYRCAFRHELGKILGTKVYYLPDEKSHGDLGSYSGSFAGISEMFPKFGRALREIDCTRTHMQQFMDSIAQETHVLISVWDMEIYKLQNLCTNLKKEVVKD